MNTNNEYTPPFTSVGDANETSAFLTSVDDHDVATIFRRTRHSYENNGLRHLLTDAEWQDTVNLIGAAPDLLAAARHLLPRARMAQRLSKADMLLLESVIAKATQP